LERIKYAALSLPLYRGNITALIHIVEQNRNGKFDDVRLAQLEIKADEKPQSAEFVECSKLILLLGGNGGLGSQLSFLNSLVRTAASVLW
jgi:hypothetical protein